MAARTPPWAIGLIVLCSLLMTAAQVLLKTALSQDRMPLLVAGVALMFVGGLALTYALKHGELSVLHPLLSLSFVWVTLGSIWLGETLGWHQYAGVAAIAIGVSLVGGSRGDT